MTPLARVTVFLRGFGDDERVTRSVDALLTNTAPSVPIFAVEGGEHYDLRVAVGRRGVVAPSNGFLARAGDVDELFGVAWRRDLVILDSQVIVGPEWLDRLSSAAYSLPNAATASPLSNSGALAVGDGAARGTPDLGAAVGPAEAARRVARVSRKSYPILPRATGRCVYIRKSALDIVGSSDEALVSGAWSGNAFSQRASNVGLVHVCADDVFVYDQGIGGVTHPDEGARSSVTPQGWDDQGWLPLSLKDLEASRCPPLSAALRLGDAALHGIRLVIDGTRLASETMGTQTVVLESARALSRHSGVAEVTVIASEATPEPVLAALRECGAKLVFSKGAGYKWEGPRDADVIYRPCQVTRTAELEWLLAIARRVVVCQLDCISYNNPSYFSNWARWSIYRRANELTFRFADGITFLSQTSRSQALRCGLSPASAGAVVYPGTDAMPVAGPRIAPGGLQETAKDFFLCLGASYKHKNRVGALRIWAAARALGWRGALVLAGPAPPEGNSLDDETEFLHEHPELRSDVWRLGTMSDAEREWLYQRAALVLYPTLSEGFGLIPFEAARRGVPCLSTRAGALDEVLPVDIPTIDPGDVSAAAGTALRIVEDRSFGEAICESLNAKAAEFSWDRSAEKLVDFLWEVIGRPSGERERLAELAGLNTTRKPRAPGRGYLTVIHHWVASATREVVERPRLRRALVPAGSRRYRLGAAAVRFMEGRER